MLRLRFVRQVGRLMCFGTAPFLLGGTAYAQKSDDPPQPLYTLRIHAIKVADDDGRRAANITPQQVKAWVDKANSIYAAAGIQFRFDPNPNGSDWSSLNNTIINNLSSSNSPAWGMANAVAATYPRSLVVFFRYGSGATPTGNGFAFPPQSGLITNFVALPGFDNTWVITGKDAANQWIWQQNIWLFAHEVGQYLGLKHTFLGWDDSTTDTPDKASDYLTAHGHTAESLDGDDLRDTPPDAGTAFYINQGWDPCRGHDSYAITGTYASGPISNRTQVPFTCTFAPDRHNIMSYFDCDPMHFTLMQVDLMRQTMQARLAQTSLTGTWTGNDGSIYYIRQIGETLWWAGMKTESIEGKDDFYVGLQYTNVFRGTLEGNTIRGKWADVPRGANLLAGMLTLSIVNSSGPGGTELRKQFQPGFGANVWQRVVRPTPTPPCELILDPSDIRCKFNQVRKNNGNGPTLLDGGDLKPYKDNVVMFGNISVDLDGGSPAGPSRSYRDFFCCRASDCSDGDLNFNIQVDRRNLDAQSRFWTDGWIRVDPNQIKAKMDRNDNDVHCEVIMYGRTGDPCDNGDSGKILLPGWMENGANSILWNGTPVNGNVASGPFPTRIFNQTLHQGTHVRVTGALVIDCGHTGCSPQVDVNNPAGVEIHPVYAIDVAQDWRHRASSDSSGVNADLTGVWAASDVGTYYVRQVGDEVWWLGISRDQGRTFANVFHGSAQYRGGDGEGLARPLIIGDWANVPIGDNGSMNSGQLRLGGSFCLDPYSPDDFNIYRSPCDLSRPLPQWNILETQFTTSGNFGSNGRQPFRWLKLYDRGAVAPR